MSAKYPLPLPFLRTKEAARFIGVSCRTLEKHRIYGTGPKFSKIGGRIIYAVSDLRAWVERGAKRSTSDPNGITAAKRVDELNLIEPIPDGETAIEVETAELARLGTLEAARFLGLSVRTVEKHRYYRTGPKFSKVGRRVFYSIDDLKEWAARGSKRSTSDPGKTTVLAAIPASKYAPKLDGSVQ